MLNRLSITLRIAKLSWRVLKADKELLVLPLLSATASLIVIVSLVSSIGFSGMERLVNDEGVVGYAVLALIYLLLTFITIFSNAAIVHAANQRLTGGEPTLGSALRGASRHFGAILIWSIVSTTVSLLLEALERSGWLGRIVTSLAQIAWSVVTFLVLPVIVVEQSDAFRAIDRSKQLLRRTWGENIAGQLGFGLLGFVLSLPGLALLVLAVVNGGAAIALGVLGVVWIVGVSLVMAALSAIFQTALYRYAMNRMLERDGDDGYFPPGTMAAAFRPA